MTGPGNAALLAKATQVHRKLLATPDGVTTAVVVDEAGNLRALRKSDIQFELDQHIITEERIVGYYDARTRVEMLIEDLAEMPNRRER